MYEALKRLVWDRAENTCEYCRLPQSPDVLPFQIDHILAEPLRDSGQVIRYRPALVGSKVPPRPFQQHDIVLDPNRQEALVGCPRMQTPQGLS
jgi:hypothetical protein